MTTWADKPPTCDGCPAKAWSVGFVPPEGEPTAVKYVIVGQGPGQTEAERSRPFFPGAPAGHRLMRWLNRGGKTRQMFLITNIVWCWLPKLAVASRGRVPPNKWGNREPTMKEARYCWKQHLRPLLKQVPESVPTITLGTPAMEMMLGTRDARRLGTLNEFTLEEIDGR